MIQAINGRSSIINFDDKAKDGKKKPAVNGILHRIGKFILDGLMTLWLNYLKSPNSQAFF